MNKFINTQFRINWHEYPFLRILIPFLLGILLAEYLPGYISSAALLLILGILSLIATSFIKSIRFKWLFGISLHLVLFSFAYLRTAQHNELNAPQHFSHYLPAEKASFTAWVAEMPEEKNWIRMTCRVEGILNSNAQAQYATGNIQIYLQKDSLSQYLSYGDLLHIRSRISPLETVKNPHAFDFSRYLHFKNIHYQAFVQADEWRKLEKKRGRFLMRQIYSLRQKLLVVLQKHLKDQEIFAVGAALTLGYRAELGEDIRTAYADTGAIHILAVSGLHVGIIYFIINWLLRFFPSYSSAQKWFKVLFALSGIWMFALLTGASSSVIRASIMFSFLTIGQQTGRFGNIYNTLAAAAFLSLVLEPYRLFTVGFQLSYLAVIGIVFFQPKIYRLLYFKYKVPDYLWQITAVSIAAQIAVSPISIFYFHQFPFYFWLSSMIVIPAAFAVLVLTLLLFSSSFLLPILGEWIGQTLHFVLSIMNGSIWLIKGFPTGLIKGLWIEWYEVLLLYGILIFVGIFIVHLHKRYLNAALLAVLLFCLSISIRASQNYFQKSITIYHQPKGSIIDFFDGRHSYSLQSEHINARNLDFNTQQHRWASGIKRVEDFKIEEIPKQRFDHLFLQFPYIQFYDKRILIYDQQAFRASSTKLEVDYLLIRNNPKLRLEEVESAVNAKQIIFDASNPFWKNQQWMKSCEELGLDCYDVRESGAFVMAF